MKIKNPTINSIIAKIQFFVLLIGIALIYKSKDKTDS
jgi:hypothetical protein